MNQAFQVLAFKGSETIDQPFFIEVQWVSENPSLDLEKLLHQPAYLDFGEPGEGLHGQIYSIGREGPGQRLTRYHLTLAAARGVPGPSLRPADFPAAQRAANYRGSA